MGNRGGEYDHSFHKCIIKMSIMKPLALYTLIYIQIDIL